MSVDGQLKPPPIRHDLTLGDILAGVLDGIAAENAAAERRIANTAMYRSAWRLSDDLAASIGVAPGDVFEALTFVPDPMLHLLDSPEGWTMLAEFVAGRLAVASPAYQPTLH